MHFSLTTTHRPATELGFLLHKHPEKVQEFTLPFGRATVVYPEADDERCTMTCVVEVDPVELVRGRPGSGGNERRLDQYVNDRPYAASSLLSVALGQVFGSALGGRCKGHEALADTPLPLEAVVSAVPCRGGAGLVRRLFEPLGYEVDIEGGPVDELFPAWGDAIHQRITLRGAARVADLLAHLYVLLPVLDGAKHYWVGEDEVEKLLRRGEGWLGAHPEREFIIGRYLTRRRRLVQSALARLVEDDVDDDDIDEHLDGEAVAAAAEPVTAVSLPVSLAARLARGDEAEARVERPLSLNEQRLSTVLDTVRASGARSVLDLGCGEGRFLALALDDRTFERVAGVDVAHRTLERAAERLGVERMPAARRARLALWHGSLTYRDRRLEGFDAAVCIEVIEHLDPHRLDGFTANLVSAIRPRTIVVTTPNREYNVRFEALAHGELRHTDHRFEWTRAEFRAWAEAAATRGGYTVDLAPIGPEDPDLGSPTQMAVLRREDAS
jgi:3' terminal RNA ribose 2'-O-methyltransferase Hen1